MVPIYKLVLKSSIGLANVTLTPSGQNTRELENIYKLLEDDAHIFKDNTLAIIHIENDNIYDAYNIAKIQIQQSLDVLMHLVRSDTLFQGFSTTDKVQYWKRDELTPKPELSSWFYIEDNFTGEYIATNTDKIIEPEALVLDDNFNSKLSLLEWYESLFFELADNKNKKIESLFSALKWLRRSWDADNAEDQIIYAIIALEFVIAGESAPPLISPNYQESIIRASLEALNEIYIGDEKEKKLIIQQLKQKLSHALTDAPLLSKMRSLIQRLNVPIAEEDIMRIKNARTLRNEVVHGKSSEALKLIDVWKLNNAIGLITAHKLKSIKGLNE
ncbi:hypothetical protein SD70_21120 [Gordoniibacillus kamchatkensis]|uniref:Apea-like HEPN domain-containing protein n=2 Tax=Gordoniibacillus kamchatkensis TaxID=1590651 RepID=A0ABR5AE21_9BACL|nr:hypothetical protein SD70_21120 [Paenibacillus sp. VKM B-2647]